MTNFNFQTPSDVEAWNNLTDEQYEQWKENYTQEEYDSLMRYLYSHEL